LIDEQPNILDLIFLTARDAFSVIGVRDARLPAKSCYTVEASDSGTIVILLTQIDRHSPAEHRERQLMTLTQWEV
jgi:hypothetical protein